MIAACSASVLTYFPYCQMHKSPERSSKQCHNSMTELPKRTGEQGRFSGCPSDVTLNVESE